MNIAIDCRYVGKSGIGRVCEGILDALDYQEHRYYLIGKREALSKYSGAQIVEDDTDPYSLAGLRSFDKSLNEICDALLIPNFLIPFGVEIPVHTVMHDLAFLDVKETTRNFIDRAIKKTLLKRCMQKSQTISCVSEFTLTRCRHYYNDLADKCYVNHNGLSESVFKYAKRKAPKKKDEIVFVGNVKPHKGLQTLLSAFSRLEGETTLKIIGEKNNFLTGLRLKESAYEHVAFTGKLDDEQLFAEIARAKYLVLPSKYEGFGLPPLEALVLGTQPIVSDIPVFREVYRGLPVKFFGTEEELTARMAEPPEDVSKAEAVIRARFRFRDCAECILEKIEQK